MRKYTPNYIHEDYMKTLQPPILATRVRKAAKILRNYDFDAVAFRGMSGAILAPILALRLGKTMIMVRKPGAYCHSDYRVEGDLGARRYVIVMTSCHPARPHAQSQRRSPKTACGCAWSATPAVTCAA